VALLLLAAWPPVFLGASRADIAEVVFRHQLVRADTDTGTYFLEIDGEDPSDDFLRRFADLPVRIRAASRALRPDPEWRGDPHSPSKVTDRDTGERGTILRIVSIGRSWINPCTVTVEGGYYAGPLAGSRDTFWVAWLGVRWIVVDEYRHRVS
jgi:hypothetical protein